MKLSKILLSLLLANQLALASFVGGGSSSSSSSSGISASGSVVDNAVTRWDSTSGTSAKSSDVSIGNKSSNKVIVNSPTVSGTATAIEVVGGASSTNSTNGGALRLGGGAPGTGGEKGAVVILGTSHTSGNYPTLISETDGAGYFGYDPTSASYKRFFAAYFSRSIMAGDPTGSRVALGPNVSDAPTSFVQFFRATSGHGMTIQNNYQNALGIYTEGGSWAFQFGSYAGAGANYGRFFLMKSSGADIYWETDGAGNIGGSTSANRPDNVYVKTGVYKGTYRMDPHEYDAGNSSTAITINWTNGSAQKVTMTDNVTFTLSNPVTGGTYVLKLVQDGTGGRTYTWPGTVSWSGGTSPTGSGASKTDIVNLYWDGTKYYGSFSLNY